MSPLYVNLLLMSRFSADQRRNTNLALKVACIKLRIDFRLNQLIGEFAKKDAANSDPGLR